MRAGWPCVAILWAVSFGGCLDSEVPAIPEPPADEPMAEAVLPEPAPDGAPAPFGTPGHRLHLGADDAVTINVDGTGWGRVDLVIEHDLKLGYRLTGDDDPAPCLDDGDDGTTPATVVFLLSEPRSNNYGMGSAVQWGTPYGSDAGLGGPACQASGVLELRADAHLHMVLFTTRDDLSIHLRAADSGTPTTKTWRLIERPDAGHTELVASRSAMVDQSGAMLGVRHEWRHDFEAPPAYVAFRWWRAVSTSDTAAYAGAADWGMEFYAASGGTAVQNTVPWPFNYKFGDASLETYTFTESAERSSDYLARVWWEEHSARTDGVAREAGAAVLVVPWAHPPER